MRDDFVNGNEPSSSGALPDGCQKPSALANEARQKSQTTQFCIPKGLGTLKGRCFCLIVLGRLDFEAVRVESFFINHMHTKIHSFEDKRGRKRRRRRSKVAMLLSSDHTASSNK